MTGDLYPSFSHGATRHQPKDKKLKIIRPHKLEPEYGIEYSNTHRQRLEDRGLFPKRVRLNPSDPRGHYGYVDEEMAAYVAARAAERDSGEAA
jgi:hypothetical protein